ncbi:MAG: RNA polymerase sigma factor [Flavobacteriia bacterium]|nr:RNA polymerase sigma factor [Flavobacteriia bacterium]
MDDTSLVTECLKGNSRAQKALFDKFAPKMLSVCLRYMKNIEKAEDALQDGFIKVFVNLLNYNNSGVLEGWIRRIIVNTCLDELKKNKKLLLNVSVEEVEYKLESNDFVQEQMMADDLMKLIQDMPAGYRVIFNMFAIEGYAHQEIATQLGISESTSKSQYLRARAYLKNRIDKR